MKKAIGYLKRGKYISLLTLLCMAFAYIADFRYYINESIYAAFNLGNLGEFGTKLIVSVLVAVFAAVGWAVGLLTAFLTRKKQVRAVTLYWLSGLFAIVALFFAPYNLQLLMPSTIMQNIAMIACIAHIVFILVDMWLFAWAICTGCIEVCKQSGIKGVVCISVFAIVATVLGFVSAACRWSFVIQTAVYGSVLAFFNVLNAAFEDGKEAEENSHVEVRCRKAYVYAVLIAITVLLIVVLIGTYFMTEQHIAIA